MHRQNSSELAIRTCKNHYIEVFSTTNKYLPISEWDHQVLQYPITMNLQRNSRVNPSILACTYLYEPYTFNKSPMAPSGTRVVLHDKPDNHTCIVDVNCSFL